MLLYNSMTALKGILNQNKDAEIMDSSSTPTNNQSENHECQCSWGHVTSGRKTQQQENSHLVCVKTLFLK